MRHSACIFLVITALSVASNAAAERLPYAQTEIVPPTPEYVASVRASAPSKPTVPTVRRNLLVFSLKTGFDHKVIPHVDRVFEILGDKSGAFDAKVTVDIEELMPENLSAVDVLVLNNNCSVGQRRHLFLDELERNPKYANLTEAQRQAKADLLERSVIEFVEQGKGLVVVHGAVVMLNNSKPFTEMVGAAFDYHPPNQAISVRAVDENHPLVAAFKGRGPFIHRDEPYCFKGAYANLDFRPLLIMDTEGLTDSAGRVGDMVRYVAWIRAHGKGRVFYCSPSHFPESYKSPTLLSFLLDGIQYAAGDLKCDDSTPPSR
jgi:type 1 glutamine amidotransferase